MTVRILCLDGIGSYGRTSGVLDRTAFRVAAHLDVTPEWVNWRAAMAGVGGAGSWDNNTAEAVRLIVEKFEEHPDDKFVLLAYSGGNYPAHRFLDEHREYLDRVLAAGFMSDPWRPRDKWQFELGDPKGYGVCGENRTPIPERCRWTAVPGDIVTAMPYDSLMRYFADACYGEPDKLVADFLAVASKGKFQVARFCGLPPVQWFLGLGPRIDAAVRAVNGYLWEGKHTTHYISPLPFADSRSLADRLGDSVAEIAQTVTVE